MKVGQLSDVGVLNKVMSVLGLLEEQTRTDPRSVARELEMSPPTAYRLMKAMASHGLLTVDDGGSYQLGPRLLHLGQLTSSRLDIVGVARPHLVRLRDLTAESVELQVLSGFRRVPVHLEVGTRSVRAMAQVGVPLPLHKGSSSRPLLIHLTERKALELARRSAEADQELASFDEAGYLSRWELARERGYDFGVGERDPELGAAAAAVRGPDGDVLCQVVVAGTAQRFRDPGHAELVLEHLQSTVRSLSQELAGSPS